MLTAKEFPNRSFATKQELYTALRENKTFLIQQKKSTIKTADAVDFYPIVDAPGHVDGISSKMLTKNIIDPATATSLTMKLAINTTNLLDSHSDVHIPGLWTKSLKVTKNRYHLQEHQMKFDKIITDDVQATAKTVTWKDLGAEYEGKTQVLTYKVTISKDRNPFMFEQYAKGYVKNHSVGMRYMKIFLAINSEHKYDVEEKEIWDKYIDAIANKEDAEAQGYFWAVTEAKEIEGSAVPMGSNPITPTMTIESDKGAVEDTPENKGAAEGTPSDSSNFFKNLI